MRYTTRRWVLFRLMKGAAMDAGGCVMIGAIVWVIFLIAAVVVGSRSDRH